jgi:hypothetical protein
VTQVWDCPSATILTSGSDSARVELKAKADVKIANVDITDLSTKFTLESEGKSTDHFVASRLTPIFRAYKVTFLGNTVPAGRGNVLFDDAPDVDPGDAKVEFEEFDPENDT